MVCLGLEPGVAGWKAQTNPLSYGGTPIFYFLLLDPVDSIWLVQKLASIPTTLNFTWLGKNSLECFVIVAKSEQPFNSPTYPLLAETIRTIKWA